MKRQFGRHHAADNRDRKYLLRPRQSSRRYRYWRTGQQLDQGQTSACVGHAWAGWLSASPIRQQPMDPHGIYDIAKHYDEWQGEDYEGTSVRGAAKVLALTGHIASYHWATTAQQVINYVLEDGPIVLGTDWYSGMSNPDYRGLMDVSGSIEGGHAYLLYGLNLNYGTAAIRNSWGSGWGKNGNALLPLSQLQRLLDNYGEACTAVESLHR